VPLPAVVFVAAQTRHAVFAEQPGDSGAERVLTDPGVARNANAERLAADAVVVVAGHAVAVHPQN
jgi:hypothetical protein